MTTYQSETLKVVPDDAVWIIESRSVPDLLKTLAQADPLFPSLQQIGIINPHLQAFKKIDSLIMGNSRFKDLGKYPAVVSLHQTGKNQYQFLIILENQGAAGASTAGELFAQLCGRSGQWSQRTYNDQQINRITFGADALIPGLSLSGNSKYLVMSPSPILIENAVRQMSQERGLYTGRAFEKLSHTAGKTALANIYVNLKALPAWLSDGMNPKLKRKMETFTRYGDWASLDISIRNDALWLTGFALEGDTLNSYLNIFKNQAPGKMEAEMYLPSATAAYFSVSVANQSLYLKHLSDFLGGGEGGRKRQKAIEKANPLSGGNVVNAWSELGFKELTIGYLCGVANDSVRPIALINVKNGEEAYKKLHNSQISPMKKVRIDSQHEYALNPMPFENLPEILGGSFFSPVAGKYFTLIGNVIVLADDVLTLEEVLHKYSLNKTLVNDAIYLSLAGKISVRSNVTFFAIPYRAKPLLQRILNPKTAETFFTNEQFLVKTGAVGLQFQSSNGMLLHNLFASFAKLDYTKPQTIWESKLDARVFTEPAIVINHITKDKEIILQDELDNLYLMNSSGRVIWKKQIGERINSRIFQIDLLKNGRLQYVFSTRSSIHMLDRNGEYLKKYPMKLPASATCGMALIDFDSNNDYRFMIACADNKVYSFDKMANIIKGWKVISTSGPVTHPVQCFKIQDKDYLVFNDPLKVYIVDRKGAVRVDPGTDFAVSPNGTAIFEPAVSGKGPRFILTDVDGNVCSILPDGTVESRKLGEFSPDHYFTMLDSNRDGQNEYVFIDRNKMDVFNQSGEKVLTRKLDGALTGSPGLYMMSDKHKRIGLTIPSKNQVFLFNGDGTPYSGFPLYGMTPFTMGSLENTASYQNLLVGSDEAYLYNYAIK
ncbi:MAG: hypothetical protein PHY99_06385 [Bacteroidales bacterium]|nr:hypothetical protein [Bacteroidales bacterium]